jgi:nucleoside phosphorylase
MAPLRNQEYTVGWICALPIELAAARAMLDENHGKPTEQHPSDKNNYHLGAIGQHKVVIACLPSGVYGTTSAATVAAHILFSFESIRIGLMVGIGGGNPSNGCDIRLGGVVASKPEGTLGGIVQYDLGKAGEDRFTRSGSSNKPPLVLLNAISSLQAEHELEGSRIPQFLSEMTTKYTNMRAEYTYQGASNDRLYEANYEHVGGDDACEFCDDSKAIHRPDRNTNAPFIHYGIIASGNQVIKHAGTRDRIGKEHGVICFEMEAAGLVDNFPCLVIRGICDYSDSHKNKHWQRYAAVAGAAYAKELLSIIPPNQMQQRLLRLKQSKLVSLRRRPMAVKVAKSYIT